MAACFIKYKINLPLFVKKNLIFLSCLFILDAEPRNLKAYIKKKPKSNDDLCQVWLGTGGNLSRRGDPPGCPYNRLPYLAFLRTSF